MKKIFILLWMLCGITLNALAQEQLEISGTVTDATGEALIGVSVTVKDAKGLGTITNIDGKYTIKMQQYQTLVFSYLGYKPVSVLVKGDRRVIDVQMAEEKLNTIDEVVITGLGAQKKLTVTGAITNVDLGQMKQFPSSNFTNALAGNVPGIIAMQSSGQPGKSTSRFWVRGISTFGASSDAMILVDGFERSNINDLNIEDIESFSVLKDASATAIYGSKGANGVILITTKHGKEGKININAKGEVAYNTRTITPKFVDAPTYATLLNEARITRNLPPQYQPEELALIRSGLDPDFYPNVDWSKLLLKDGAMSYRADLSLELSYECGHRRYAHNGYQAGRIGQPQQAQQSWSWRPICMGRTLWFQRPKFSRPLFQWLCSGLRSPKISNEPLGFCHTHRLQPRMGQQHTDKRNGRPKVGFHYPWPLVYRQVRIRHL